MYLDINYSTNYVRNVTDLQFECFVPVKETNTIHPHRLSSFNLLYTFKTVRPPDRTKRWDCFLYFCYDRTVNRQQSSSLE